MPFRAKSTRRTSQYFCDANSARTAILSGVFPVVRLADEKNETKRAWVLYASIALLVGPLVAFKAMGALSGVFIPLGLSYYTFKLTSYVLETYWDPKYVQRRFVDLAAYSAFGAQLVSGPIQRPASFFEQLREPRLADADFEKAFRLILHGLFLKLVIGDRLGTFTEMIA